MYCQTRSIRRGRWRKPHSRQAHIARQLETGPLLQRRAVNAKNGDPKVAVTALEEPASHSYERCSRYTPYATRIGGKMTIVNFAFAVR
jgi:hypothetical protein